MPTLVFPDPIGVDKDGEPVYTTSVPDPAPPVFFVDRSPPPEFRPLTNQYTVPKSCHQRYLLDRVEGDYAYYVPEEDREILDLEDQTQKYGRVIYGESALDWVIGTKSRYGMASGLRPEEPIMTPEEIRFMEVIEFLRQWTNAKKKD